MISQLIKNILLDSWFAGCLFVEDFGWVVVVINSRSLKFAAWRKCNTKFHSSVNESIVIGLWILPGITVCILKPCYFQNTFND